MSRRNFHVGLLAAGLLTLAGCQTCRRVEYTAVQTPCNRCYTGPLPPRIAPVPTVVPAPYPPVVPPAVPPVRVEGPAQASFVPATPPSAPPADTPAPMPPGPDTPPPTRRDAARPPDPKEPPPASVPSEPPPRAEEREDSTNIDLPGFQVVRPGVATGIKPYLDGVAWLKSHGYRTVLHLRQPGEDDVGQKRRFENKGLTYLSLEASPARLTKELYEEFVKIVEDRGNRPLFVYDRDGAVAGGLWWLYFRVHLTYSDEKARAEAKRLGLQFDEYAPEEHQTMVLAVQRLLSKLKP